MQFLARALLVFLFAVATGGSLISCLAPSEQRDFVLDIPIDASNDSLLTFDTLIVKVYSKDSSYRQEVFHGLLTDPKGLIGLPLDRSVGREFTVSIIGYKDGKLGVHLEVKIRDLKPAGARDVPIKDIIQIDPVLPEILAPSDTSIAEGEQLRIRVEVRNPWSSPATLILKEGPPGASLDTAGTESRYAYFTITPTYAQGRGDPYAVTLVHASAGRQVEKVMRLTIQNVNRPPRFSAIADQQAKEYVLLTFRVEALDPDGDSLTFVAMDLPAGATFEDRTFAWKPSVGQAGNHAVKFKVHDGQDSDFVSVWIAVGDVDPPPPLTLEIVSPASDTAVNTSPITVQYTVNGMRLQRQVPLKEGGNRIFLDTTILGRTAFDTLWVILDLTAPGAPKVNGPTPVNTRTPSWTWISGGGGNGTYRYQLDSEDMIGATLSKDTAYIAPKDLEPGSHTLFVQERDEAGNWSSSGRHAIRIDTTRPPPPMVTVFPVSPTNDTRPTWSWKIAGEDVAGIFRYKLNSEDFRSGAIQTEQTSYRPDESKVLTEGPNTLYVQQRDSAGNWSLPGSALIVVDLTPPNPPVVTSRSMRTTNLRPTWSWISGGNGDQGFFRHKLNDSSMQMGAMIAPGSSYTPAEDLTVGTRYTLFVQERDSAGNWSQPGSYTVRLHGRTGFVVGYENTEPPYRGAVLRTRNAGSSWDSLSGGIPPVLLSVHFVNANVGFIAGDSGALVKTINGGDSWISLATPTAQSLTSVYFTDTNTGYVTGNKGAILKTINAGTSWVTQNSGTSQALLSVHFPTFDTGYAVGDSGIILKTINGGATWSLLPKFTSQILKSVIFVDSKIGHVVGFNGAIAKTSDGGERWSTPSTVATTNSLYSTSFTSASTGYAVGGLGTIIKTTDGGASWRTLPSRTDEWLQSVFFPDEDVGYAVGRRGILLKTLDGGDSWTQISKDIEKQFNSIHFP